MECPSVESTTNLRESMADRVKRVLLQQIVTGKLAAGTRLLELQLAKEFDTSQGPVREALRELEAMGLVFTQPYKGTYVREVTNKEICEAYSVRALLEGHAGQLAASRLKDDVKLLATEASAVREAARKKNAERYAHHDIRFHRLIVEAAGSQVLLRTWDSLTLAVRVRLWLMKGYVDMEEAEKAHWPIVDALEAGNGRLAGRLLSQHIRQVMQMHATGAEAATGVSAIARGMRGR